MFRRFRKGEEKEEGAVVPASDEEEEENGNEDEKETSAASQPETVAPVNKSEDEQVAVEIISSGLGGYGSRLVENADPTERMPSTRQDYREEMSARGAGDVAELADAGSLTINLDLRGEYKKPVRALARKYRDTHHPRGEEGEQLTVMNSPTGYFPFLCFRKGHNNDLLRFGAGISSYFKWLKWLFWMYLLLFLIQLPVIIFNVNAGDYFVGSSFRLAETTLGNLYREPPGNTSLAIIVEEYELDLGPLCSDGACVLDRSSMLFYYGVIDAATTLIFLMFVCLAKRFLYLERKRFKEKILKVEHYTLEVEFKKEDATAEELKDHFNQLVQSDVVHDVQIIQSSNNAIALCVKRGKLIKDLARADAMRKYLEKNNASLSKREKAQQKYDDIYQQVVGLDLEATKRAEQGAALFAFVTFQKQSDRAKVLQLYKAWTCSLRQVEALRLNGQTYMKVTEAPPPSTLLWENNEVSPISRYMRGTLTTLLLILLLFGTVFINYLTEPFKVSKSFADTVSGAGTSDTICGGVFAPALDFDDAIDIAEDAVTIDNFALPGREELNPAQCLCEASLTNNLVFSNTSGEPDGLFSGTGFCAGYLESRTKDISIQVAVSFGTLLMNTVIFFVLSGTAFFNRYTSIMKREKTILIRLFVVTYVNTALVVLIVNADLEEIFGIDLSSGVRQLFSRGSFVDFTQEWFRVVGVEVMLFAFLNVFAPQVSFSFRLTLLLACAGFFFLTIIFLHSTKGLPNHSRSCQHSLQESPPANFAIRAKLDVSWAGLHLELPLLSGADGELLCLDVFNRNSDSLLLPVAATSSHLCC